MFLLLRYRRRLRIPGAVHFYFAIWYQYETTVVTAVNIIPVNTNQQLGCHQLVIMCTGRLEAERTLHFTPVIQESVARCFAPNAYHMPTEYQYFYFLFPCVGVTAGYCCWVRRRVRFIKFKVVFRSLWRSVFRCRVSVVWRLLVCVVASLLL